MRERPCWSHISPLQTILRTWWNIWLIQLPHSPDLSVHQGKLTLSHLLLQLIWQQLSLHSWNSQWKRPVSMSLRPTNIIRHGNDSWIKNSLPVVCICQDYPISFTELSQSLNEVEQQEKGKGSGTHHSQGDHRWNCPHSWVLLKCSADSFTAVPQQTFLHHETISYRWQNPAQRPEKITKAKQIQQNKQIS